MPGVGPSRGCHACRKRKIKCDETRPSCLRCGKIGVLCPGYRDTGPLAFRNATQSMRAGGVLDNSVISSSASQSSASSYAVPSAMPVSGDWEGDVNAAMSATTVSGAPSLSPPDFLTQWGPSISSRASSLDAIDFSDFPFRSLLEEQTISTDASPGSVGSTDLQGVEYFFHNFVIHPSNSDACGWLSSLPQLYSTAPDGSCLKLAVQAASLAYAGPNLATQTDLSEARKYHGKALLALREALLNHQKVLEDSTLCTVMVLVVYENVSDDSFRSFGLHRDGFRAILRLRQTSSSPEQQYDLMSHYAAVQLLLSSLRLSEELPREAVQIFEHPNLCDPASELLSCCVRANQARADAGELLLQPGDDSAYWQALLTAMRKCDQADPPLRTSIESHFDRWITFSQQQTRFEAETGTTNNVSASELASFPRVLIVALGARMLLHETILECTYNYSTYSPQTDYFSLSAQTTYSRSLAQISEVADQIMTLAHSVLNLPIEPPILSQQPPPPRRDTRETGQGILVLALLSPLGIICRCPFILPPPSPPGRQQTSANPPQVEFSESALEILASQYGLRRARTLMRVWRTEREKWSTPTGDVAGNEHWSRRVLRIARGRE